MGSGIFVADIGTSSLKAAIISQDGKVLQYQRVFFPQPVKAQDWVRSFFTVFERLRAVHHVIAITISGNGPSVVAVHKKSHAEDQLILWNQAGASDPRCGVSLFLPKVLLLLQRLHFCARDVQFFLSSHEYLIYRLTGCAVTVLPERRYMPTYWTSESLRACALPETLFAPFVAPGSIVASYRGIPVVCGAPDFAAALIGTNTLHAGSGCDRAGSSEGLNVCVRLPPAIRSADARVRVLPSLRADFWNVSFLIADSGSRFASYMRRTHAQGFGERMGQIMALPFQLHDAYPPTVVGEGRQLVEDLAFEVCAGLEYLESVTQLQPVYTVSGGQAKDSHWLQLKADVSGRCFVLPEIHDAELTGNAALACVALDFDADMQTAAQRLCRLKREFIPNRARHEQYAQKRLLRAAREAQG